MVSLVFFSTNRTKLAHFRYLGDREGVKVRGFHEITYRASYHEPAIDDRSELLRLSYLSALKQWRSSQNNPDDGSSTFFFEDTSVIISALSQEKETPGVNVKYWMRDMSFGKLDALLKLYGEDRTARVRSDIIMHLPSSWKKLLKTEDDFVWVYGEVTGKVIEAETSIRPNLVYPWLDGRSFNRWFMPKGASYPLSALNIEDADKGDFRAEAFRKLTSILDRLSPRSEAQDASQFQFEFPDVQTFPSIFLICGPSCAGKTTAAAWLSEKFKISHIEASDFMYKAFWERHGLNSDVKIGDFAEAALNSQPDIVVQPIVQHISREQFSSVVVTGFRSPTEVNIFLSKLGPERHVEILFLTANAEIRFQRSIARGRDGVTPEKFEAREAQEKRMGLFDISGIKQVSVIDNDAALVDFYAQILEKYGSSLEMCKRSSESMKKKVFFLEAFILKTLYEIFVTGRWLTTTEIAFEINKLFSLKKSKNNVSRYFNQGYHSYYEARVRLKEGKKTGAVEYRLSATGYSAAMLLPEHSGGHGRESVPITRNLPGLL